MRILMFTNTFTPHVGGVARSVDQFAKEFRSQGHRVMIVAPEFDGAGEEADTVRVPAVQNFNGSDFSVPMPIPGFLQRVISDFQPQIIHSHHPFLLGDTALRTSASFDTPIVFTHHTQYERYTHYVPGDSPAMQQFVIDLAVGYCNLSDAVIAPSDSIRRRLREQGVTAPVFEIPTGVDTSLFGSGNAKYTRQELDIDPGEFVVGHVGRLAPEKRIDFLADAVAQFVAAYRDTKFLVAGTGPSEKSIIDAFATKGISDRLILLGSLERPQLADVYAAMDVFAFASQSETQGMVLTEAMAASTPVVAVDASGVREVLRDGINGQMLPTESKQDFVEALTDVYRMSDSDYAELVTGALLTADNFSMASTAQTALDLYDDLIKKGRGGPHGDDMWSRSQRLLDEEWRIWSNIVGAASHAVFGV